MSTHWSDYSLRGWLSFLAFMHIGMSMRSFFDSTFLYGRIFSVNTAAIKEPILVRFFGVFSLSQAFILLQAAIHLYSVPVQVIAMFMLAVFVAVVSAEAFVFQTLNFYDGTLLPCTMSVISLVWLALFHFFWKPWMRHSVVEDTSMRFIQESKKKGRNTEQFFRMQHESIRRSSAKVHSD